VPRVVPIADRTGRVVNYQPVALSVIIRMASSELSTETRASVD